MRIRKAQLSDAVSIAKVHVESWKTTYQGIISKAYLNRMDLDSRIQRWQRFLASESTMIIHVLENKGEVVGFASAGKNRTEINGYDGELFAIYLLKTYQKQGWGTKLMVSVLNQLHNDGHQSLLVWVLKENPSMQFYQKVLPYKIKEGRLEIGTNQHVEVALGWKFLQVLLQKLKQRD